MHTSIKKITLITLINKVDGTWVGSNGSGPDEGHRRVRWRSPRSRLLYNLPEMGISTDNHQPGSGGPKLLDKKKSRKAFSKMPTRERGYLRPN